MNRLIDRRNNIRASLAVMVFVFSLLSQSIFSRAEAAELTNRSLFIESSFASEITAHNYSFASNGPSTVQSMQFEYCVNSPLFNVACVAPAGVDVSSFSIINQTGVIGYSVSPATTSNAAILNRAISLVPPTASTYRLGNIQNPSTTNQTVYVRIAVFDGPNATGSRVDQGAVAFVVENRFDVQVFVPPYLTFCAAITVTLDCSTVGGFIDNFGELSSSSTASASSQFAAATNDLDGYNTFVNGQTMTSGNNVINSLATQTASSVGTSQFGINLIANSNPLVGANVESGALGAGTVDPNYNQVNRFRFSNGDRVAGSSVPTGFNRFTVSYIVNIPQGQDPGVYSTTLTYTAIATF